MNLFPTPGCAYYIVSPPFTEKSAGVNVLHRLCHALNVSGQRAYMVGMNTPPQGGETYCAQFVAPPLGPEAKQYYATQRIEPIVVYPDIVSGNPLNAKRVVRWLLAHAGAYGGDKTFPATDSVWCYSTRIARRAGYSNVLNCPAADPSVFVPLPNVERAGTCFYSYKHRLFGGRLTEDVRHSTEITRQMPRPEMIRLLQHSELFYSYEDTFLIMEAVLCGCPVVLLPNETFEECHTLEDYGSSGVAWGNEPVEIENARATVARGRGDYFKVIGTFWTQLDRFIRETQNNDAAAPGLAASAFEHARTSVPFGIGYRIAPVRENWSEIASSKRVPFELSIMNTNGNASHALASIIVPSWNQLEFTRHCVRSLVRHTRLPWELIVINNGSTDSTGDYLAGVQDAAPAPITIIANATNRGFPAAVNQGLQAARGEYLVLLNNDVVVTSDWLEQMIALADAEAGPRPGCASPPPLTPPSQGGERCSSVGGLRVGAIGLVGPMSNYAAPPQLVDDVPYHDLHEIDEFARRWRDEHRGQWFTASKLSGFCLLMKRAVYDKIGGLDERFGLGFFDDDDLAERARRAGFELAVAHDLFIHHFGSRTFIGNGVDAEKMLEENSRRFAAKWGTRENGRRRAALRPFVSNGTCGANKTGLLQSHSVPPQAHAAPGPIPARSASEGSATESTDHTPIPARSASEGSDRESNGRIPILARSASEGSAAESTRHGTSDRTAAILTPPRLRFGLVSPATDSVSVVGTVRVSLTMIVRNEENNLPRCLESVRGLFDEIVIVDTGSTDRTIEVARSFGARVFDFPWVDDFGAGAMPPLPEPPAIMPFGLMPTMLSNRRRGRSSSGCSVSWARVSRPCCARVSRPCSITLAAGRTWPDRRSLCSARVSRPPLPCIDRRHR